MIRAKEHKHWWGNCITNDDGTLHAESIVGNAVQMVDLREIPNGRTRRALARAATRADAKATGRTSIPLDVALRLVWNPVKDLHSVNNVFLTEETLGDMTDGIVRFHDSGGHHVLSVPRAQFVFLRESTGANRFSAYQSQGPLRMYRDTTMVAVIVRVREGKP